MSHRENIIDLALTVPKPVATVVTADARLFGLNDAASQGMLAICQRYGLSRDGLSWETTPTPDDAARELLDWLADFIDAIHDQALVQATIDAVFPVPDGADHEGCHQLFAAANLPEPADLTHVLYALGLSATTITAALLLLHQARHPSRRRPHSEISG